MGHDPELKQVDGAAIHVGPHVQEDHFVRDSPKEAHEGRSLNPLDPAQGQQACSQHGPGVPRTHHRIGLAPPDQFEGHPDGGVLFPAHRLERRLPHEDLFRAGMDPHAGRWAEALELLLDRLWKAHEDDIDSPFGGSLERTLNHHFRSVISSHGVHGDLHAQLSSFFSIRVLPLYTPQWGQM